MTNPRQCIILGSGTSVNQGINLGLFDKIRDKFTINIHYMHELFGATFLSFVDPVSFYKTNLPKLTDLPLIIGRHATEIEDIRLNNTILLPYSPIYSRDLNPGVYSEWLGGLWTLSLAIYLLDIGEIFCLGFDAGCGVSKGNASLTTIRLGKNSTEIPVEDITNSPEKICNETNIIKQDNKIYRPITHCYQDNINHIGVGRIKFYYATDKINKVFEVYKPETKIKIYNVSPDSRINTFEKIDYNTMFSKLNNETVDQDELRLHIKNLLKEKEIK